MTTVVPGGGQVIRDADALRPLGEPMIGDALGETLSRCWAAGGRSGVAFEVLERSDGCVFVTDAATYFAGPEEWDAPERWACDQARGRVLDVGCGAGRHALVLRERGYEVVGIDHSPGAVAVARDRGVDARERALEAVDDIGTFDTLLLLGNNLGLLRGRAEAPAILRCLARLARPGAVLLGGSIDPHRTRRPEHLAYQAWNRGHGRLPHEQRLRIRGRTVSTPWFGYLHLSLEELSDLVAGSPWRLDDSEQEGVGYVARLRLRDAG